MLTKNYYAMMLICGGRLTCPMKTINGSDFTCEYDSQRFNAAYYGPFYGMRCYQPTPASSNIGVMFGSGRTNATVNDFALEEPITSGLNVTQPSAITVNRTELYEEYVVTFGVTATEAVTIGEIGLSGCCSTKESVDGIQAGSTVNYLADRTVLETPVTLAAGESKQITYAIRFNYPTA